MVVMGFGVLSLFEYGAAGQVGEAAGDDAEWFAPSVSVYCGDTQPVVGRCPVVHGGGFWRLAIDS